MAQLCRHEEELGKLNAVVLVVSFGAQKEAKDWSEEICPSFRLLLDPGRAVYRAYKVEHSWVRSWNMRTLAYYVRALLGGRDWHGIKGDSAHLGGDFIINPDRTFELVHPSREATDRPDVSEMLNLLRDQDS